jgi:tetratricopeptide (TPR) repeat protein
VLTFQYPAGKAWSQQQLWTAAWCELLLSDIQYFRGRTTDAIKCLEQLRGMLRPLPECTADAQPLFAVHVPDWLVWLELRARLTRAHLAQSAHVACRAEAEVALQEAAAVNEVRLCREVTRLRVLLDVSLGHSELAVLGFSEILSQAQHQDDRSFRAAVATVEFAELQRTLGNRTAALQAFMDAEKLLLAQLEAHGYWEATTVHVPHVETAAMAKLRVAQLLEQQEQTAEAEARALEAATLLTKCAKPSKALLASVRLLLGRIAASNASAPPVVAGGAIVNWGGEIGAAVQGEPSAKATLSQAHAHAVDELERSLALAAEHGGHTHPQISAALLELANIYAMHGDAPASAPAEAEAEAAPHTGTSAVPESVRLLAASAYLIAAQRVSAMRRSVLRGVKDVPAASPVPNLALCPEFVIAELKASKVLPDGAVSALTFGQLDNLVCRTLACCVWRGSSCMLVLACSSCRFSPSRRPRFSPIAWPWKRRRGCTSSSRRRFRRLPPRARSKHRRRSRRRRPSRR